MRARRRRVSGAAMGMASQTLSARLWLDVCRAQMVFAQSVQAHLAAAGADRTTEASEAEGA